MKNVSHKNKWISGTVQVHVKPPLILLLKINNNEKPDKYSIKI